MDMNAIVERRAALLAQCAPEAEPNAETAAAMPIHVTAWGESGPEVLVIHGGVQGGLGGGPSTFDGQRALAERGWRLRLVDRPGFGKSPSRGRDDMERDAVWIADLLGEGAHLVGHSFGGAEALLAAARRPAAVRSLTLIEPALHPLLMMDPAVSPEAKADAGKLLGLILAAHSPGDYALSFARAMGASRAPGDASNAAAEALEADPERATRMGCFLLRARMAPPPALMAAAAAVRAAGVPVLAISGGWSPAFDAIGEVGTRLTGGRHVVVPSSDHFVQRSNAPAFNDTLDAFLKQAESGRVAS